MYIPEFWCGVIITIGAEIIVMILYSITNGRK